MDNQTGELNMNGHERRKILEELTLPTEKVREQVLEIFQELCIVKKDTQDFFLIQEIHYAVKATWDGDDVPTMNDIVFYLDQAVLTHKEQYRKHSEFGYRYLYNRDH